MRGSSHQWTESRTELYTERPSTKSFIQKTGFVPADSTDKHTQTIGECIFSLVLKTHIFAVQSKFSVRAAAGLLCSKMTIHYEGDLFGDNSAFSFSADAQHVLPAMCFDFNCLFRLSVIVLGRKPRRHIYYVVICKRKSVSSSLVGVS